jgi:hypothetical protein
MKKLIILSLMLFTLGFMNAQSTSEKSIAEWNILLFETPFPDDWKKALTGKQKVFTNSPIYNSPDMVFGGKIGSASTEVEVITKHNPRYYFVKSNGVEGFLWTGWFYGHSIN